MKRVFQTIFSNVNGNCYQASIASILGLELNEVPHFAELYSDETYHWELQIWLSQFGLMALRVPFREVENGVIVCPFLSLPESWCLAIGKSRNYPNINHAVVGKVIQGNQFLLEHDPLPNGEGLLGDPTCLEFFVPKSPKIK